jgi:hypothetical protein
MAEKGMLRLAYSSPDRVRSHRCPICHQEKEYYIFICNQCQVTALFYY